MATMTRRRVARRTDFGKRLTDLRDRLGLTQTEAAKKVGASFRAWSDWERGKRKPHPVFIKIIKEELGKF